MLTVDTRPVHQRLPSPTKLRYCSFTTAHDRVNTDTSGWWGTVLPDFRSVAVCTHLLMCRDEYHKARLIARQVHVLNITALLPPFPCKHMQYLSLSRFPHLKVSCRTTGKASHCSVVPPDLYHNLHAQNVCGELWSVVMWCVNLCSFSLSIE